MCGLLSDDHGGDVDCSEHHEDACTVPSEEVSQPRILQPLSSVQL